MGAIVVSAMSDGGCVVKELQFWHVTWQIG